MEDDSKLSDAESSDVEDYAELNANQNRKKKKAGGWQSLGLDHSVFKGISKKGYQQPTPIQRKAIPPILDGKDVVAMSRTGSGKTAAFVIPMLQKLKQRDVKGVRALFISPTRELANQTFQVVKEMGKFTGLRCACLIGGDSIEEDFDALHQNPDVIIATPGRLLHVVVEMNLRLNQVCYVVFDEADRLFEMGFLEQLWDILKRLPDNRQTLLFSATMPKMMVDFAKAGLVDPVLVRLDVDTKISEKLLMRFFLTRDGDKISALLHMARQFVDKQEQTIIFCATIRHVEYYVALFREANIDASYVHSQLDPAARRMNIHRFKEKQTMLLVVTDVAARGVDIPLLDNAINVHFPEKPKLFVHRVGRVARAGKSGSAFSFVSYEELPYLIDLFLFLGRDLKFATTDDEYKDEDSVIGKYPENMVHLETEFLKNVHEQALEMSDLQYKSENAMKKYIKTRQPPSVESVRRVKTNYRHLELAVHPYFKDSNVTKKESDFLAAIKNWRPSAKVFELNKHSIQTRKVGPTITERVDVKLAAAAKMTTKRRREEEIEREKRENYVSYFPSDYFTEKALKVDGNFENAAKEATIDINADDDKGLYKKQNAKKWDRKGEEICKNTVKKIRTEDGTLLPASYRSGRYDSWVEKQKISYADDVDGVDNLGPKGSRKWKVKQRGAQVKDERRSAPQIAKERKRKEKIQNFQQERRKKRVDKQKRSRPGKSDTGHSFKNKSRGSRQFEMIF
ncbi:DNA RNA helicase and DBP10CT domain containing protein [Aphelenchoides bicaudatus]|nr:DNA RNA helicase and DBP10CT domain containing protein [Aphelenchoides bicaudatus]